MTVETISSWEQAGGGIKHNPEEKQAAEQKYRWTVYIRMTKITDKGREKINNEIKWEMKK